MTTWCRPPAPQRYPRPRMAGTHILYLAEIDPPARRQTFSGGVTSPATELERHTVLIGPRTCRIPV